MIKIARKDERPQHSVETVILNQFSKA